MAPPKAARPGFLAYPGRATYSSDAGIMTEANRKDNVRFRNEGTRQRPPLPMNGPGRKRALEVAEAKPPILPVHQAGIPGALRAIPHWIAWRYERRSDKDGRLKWTKIPINPKTGRNAKPNDPSTWGTFDEALTCYRQRRLDGIGYMFAADDPFCGVDFDDCRDPETGALDEWAAYCIQELDSYAEVSPTRTGVKAFVRAKKPP